MLFALLFFCFPNLGLGQAYEFCDNTTACPIGAPKFFPVNCRCRFDFASHSQFYDGVWFFYGIPRQNVYADFLCDNNVASKVLYFSPKVSADGGACLPPVPPNCYGQKSSVIWHWNSSDLNLTQFAFAITDWNLADDASIVCNLIVQCTAGWTGQNCTTPICPMGCGNGTCVSPNNCSCESGWGGDQCSIPICTKPCLNGNCTAPNVCNCVPGWNDTQCSEPICANNCTGNGRCVEPGICSCELGWKGAACNISDPLFLGMPLSLRNIQTQRVLGVTGSQVQMLSLTNQFSGVALFRIFLAANATNYSQIPSDAAVRYSSGDYNLTEVAACTGQNITTVIGTMAVEDCSAACTSVPTCTSWVLDRNINNCTLMTSVTSFVKGYGLGTLGQRVQSAEWRVVFQLVESEFDGPPRYLRCTDSMSVDVSGSDPSDPSVQFLIYSYPTPNNTLSVRPAFVLDGSAVLNANVVDNTVNLSTSLETSALWEFSGVATSSYLMDVVAQAQVFSMSGNSSLALHLLQETCNLLPVYSTAAQHNPPLIDPGVILPLNTSCQSLNNLNNGLDWYGMKYDFITPLDYTAYQNTIEQLLVVLQQYETAEQKMQDTGLDLDTMIKVTTASLEEIEQDAQSWAKKFEDNTALLAGYGSAIVQTQASMSSSYQAIAQEAAQGISNLNNDIQTLNKEIDEAKDEAAALTVLGIFSNIVSIGNSLAAMASGRTGIVSGVPAIYEKIKNSYALLSANPEVAKLQQELAQAQQSLNDMATLINMTKALQQLEEEISTNASLPSMLPALYGMNVLSSSLQNYLAAYQQSLRLDPNLQYHLLDLVSNTQTYFQQVNLWYQVAMTMQDEQSKLDLLQFRANAVRSQLGDLSQQEAAAAQGRLLVSTQREQQLVLTLKYLAMEVKQFQFWSLQHFAMRLPTHPTSTDLRNVQNSLYQAVLEEQTRQQSVTLVAWWKYTATRERADFSQFGTSSPTPEPNHMTWLKITGISLGVATALGICFMLVLVKKHKKSTSLLDSNNDSSSPLMLNGPPSNAKNYAKWFCLVFCVGFGISFLITAFATHAFTNSLRLTTTTAEPIDKSVFITVAIPYDNSSLTNFNDVRMIDVRAVLLGNEIMLSPTQSALEVQLIHVRNSFFLDSTMNLHTFLHEDVVYHYFYNMANSCPLSASCSPESCPAYINYSPYGVWQVIVSGGQKVDLSKVTAIELHFKLRYQTAKNGEPKPMFLRDDVRYPFTPCQP